MVTIRVGCIWNTHARLIGRTLKSLALGRKHLHVWDANGPRVMFAHARRRLTVLQTALTKHRRYVCFGMFTFAFSLLTARLVAECRRACELDDVTHGTEFESIQAIKER